MVFFVFFFKQKTAYEMRISDWSSDVCSSDLAVARADFVDFYARGASVHAMTPRARSWARCWSVRPAAASTVSVCSPRVGARSWMAPGLVDNMGNTAGIPTRTPLADRKSVGTGQRGAVRVDHGGPRSIKKK